MFLVILVNMMERKRKEEGEIKRKRKIEKETVW